MSKTTRITIITTIALSILGGMIVAWAVYGKRAVVLKDTGKVLSITDDNFEKEVVKASMKRPVLVDFYAEWCFPCRALEPIIKEVAHDLKDRAVIGKVDTDKNLIARRFGVTKIPAIFIIKDGEIKNAFYGIVSKDTLVKALSEFGS